MATNPGTPFDVVCEILADMWVNHKTEEGLEDFISYNDIGLPLAFAVAEGMATISDKGKTFINETWNLLLATLEIEEDAGYESFDDLMLG
jgi:uncharacterized protein YaiI (UPF0178 family)